MVGMKIETLIDVKIYHGSVLDSLVLIHELECEEVKENCNKDLHLPVCKLFAYADPWPSLHRFKKNRSHDNVFLSCISGDQVITYILVKEN